MKKTKRPSGLIVAFTAVILCTTLTTPLRAQDPGDRFLPVEEGLLDLETGLVWGYPLEETCAYLHTIGRSELGIAYLWDEAITLELAHDPDNEDHFATYTEFSNWYAGRNDDDWRLPTRDEMVEAAQSGILDYLDHSPADGFQSWYRADGGPRYSSMWSSTFAGKIRGRDSAYIVNLYTGATDTTAVKSLIYAPAPVRGVPAPAEDDGPGNGKGKKK